MLILVFGGSGSGKSEYAEKLALEEEKDLRWYLATMHNDGSEEGLARIRKHREKRKNKGFQTLEWDRDLPGHLDSWKEWETPSVILLEDLGNLVANEMFSSGGALKDAEPEKEEDKIREWVTEPIDSLHQQGHTVIVVCDILDEDGPLVGKELNRYDGWMAAAVRDLAERADQLVEVIAGIPNRIR